MTWLPACLAQLTGALDLTGQFLTHDQVRTCSPQRLLLGVPHPPLVRAQVHRIHHLFVQRSVTTCEFARAVLDGTRVEGGTCMLAGAASVLNFTHITTTTLYQLGNASDTDMFSSANASHKWPRRLPSPLPTACRRCVARVGTCMVPVWFPL